ncbi:MAG: hypothetical protein LUQ11_08400 [Methylococcaceae bacterium]|nr:hypothetical protein [Methylococcaceae bacterium]
MLKALGMAVLFVGGLANSNLAAKDRAEQGSQKKHPHNLPDIDVTEEETLAIDQEINVNSASAVSNSSIDYGLPKGWNIGVSFLNAQFYVSRSDAWSFQPDALMNLEKHWNLGPGRLVIGTQTGAGFLAQGTVVMSYSYLDFQQHFSDWDVDFDVGSYYANARVAGWQSVGLHVNIEIPLGGVLRLNGDYLSGGNGVAATTLKLLYPLSKDLQLAAGIQVAGAQNTGDDYAGLLGLYWH